MLCFSGSAVADNQTGTEQQVGVMLLSFLFSVCIHMERSRGGGTPTCSPNASPVSDIARLKCDSTRCKKQKLF